MEYTIQEIENGVVLKDARDFELPHIFECGQCFRWNREADDSFTGVAKGRILNVSKKGKDVIFHGTNLEEFQQVWVEYFDLNRDYGDIKDKLTKGDPIMESAIASGHGIRLLNQDEWETLISFIVSSNRGIPIIKSSIEEMCRKYGQDLGEYRGRKYYGFPKPEVIATKTIEEINSCKMGYRSKYILDAARIVAEKQMNIYAIKNLDTSDARRELLRITGVGPKVADCILLFSMEKYDAFPIDVWVKRVMEYFYLSEGSILKAIQQDAQKRFGVYAGFAQQYLFYYARELGIGKS